MLLIFVTATGCGNWRCPHFWGTIDFYLLSWANGF